MRAKAIRDLAQLSDAELFRVVAEGLELISKNAARLEQDARVLYDQERPQGYRALLGHAKEEAAKVLILLDAVRCPRQPSDIFTRQLGAFDRHLAKGVYAESYGWRPATFGDIDRWTKQLRRQFYLDGPEGVDWISRNSVLDERESGIYVDYVARDEGHCWVAPFPNTTIVALHYFSPRVLHVVSALEEVGCFDAKALEIIAATWRPLSLTPEFHCEELRALNRKTLATMEANGLLRPAADETHATVIDEWLFPLYSLDLATEIPVNKDELRARQADWYYREMGITNDEW